MYDVAVDVYRGIAEVIHDGTNINEVLDVAEYIHTAGFNIYDDLLHGFGGGDSPPILRTRQTSARPPQPFVFRENMTIVIQPNVIATDQRMGVQVGELVRGNPRWHRVTAPLSNAFHSVWIANILQFFYCTTT